ncbi:MAG: hypothetical protein AAYR33_07130 [Acetobacteraceae bacterium]
MLSHSSCRVSEGNIHHALNLTPFIQLFHFRHFCDINCRIVIARPGSPGCSRKAGGSFPLEAKSADIGIGFTWGEGKLTYKGRAYRFKVSGGNIAAVGFSKITAIGTVYNLKNLHDFDGGYAALNGDVTLDRGIGGAVMSNSNGVKVKFTSATRGAHLAAGA